MTQEGGLLLLSTGKQPKNFKQYVTYCIFSLADFVRRSPPYNYHAKLK